MMRQHDEAVELGDGGGGELALRRLVAVATVAAPIAQRREQVRQRRVLRQLGVALCAREFYKRTLGSISSEGGVVFGSCGVL